MDCTMKPDLTDDQLDALLADQPLVARRDFTSITVQRLDMVSVDEELEWLLDDELSRQPATPSADFTTRTVQAALASSVPATGYKSFFNASALRLAALAAVGTVVAWMVLRPELETVPATSQQVVSAPSHQPLIPATMGNSVFDTTSLRLISIMHDLDMTAEGAWDSHPMETLALLTLQ